MLETATSVMSPHSILVAVTIVAVSSCVLTIVSIASEHWIEATALLTEGLKSNISYGLFRGTVERQEMASTLRFTLTLVCDFEANACIYSCQKDSERRHHELKLVLRHQDLEPCEQQLHLPSTKANNQQLYINSSHAIRKTHHSAFTEAPYIGASVHLCSVMFLCLGLAFSLMAFACSAINLRWHPVESVFNIYGLYIWNSIAAGCCFWSMALWTALFRNHLRYNIAITDTLRQQLNFTSEGYARLGYSYYFVIVIISLHIINLALLFVRRYGMKTQPQQHTTNAKATNNTESRMDFY